MHSSLWKYLMIITVVVVSLVYSLPNLYPDEPAIQISGASASIPADQAVLESATRALKVAGLPFHGAEAQDKGKEVLIRVSSPDVQLRAQEVVRRELGENYVVALNLAQTTPAWLKALRAAPMKLGLDLRGGVHFLLEVDMGKALEQRQESYVADIKAKLREKKLSYRSVAENGQGFALKFEKAEDRQKAEDQLKIDFNEFTYVDRNAADGFYVDLAFTPQKLRELSDYAVNQNITTIRNRVNELGVAEALVQRQGASRIVVELPGIQDTAEAKRILGRTATLEFRAVDDSHPNDGVRVTAPGVESFPYKNDAGRYVAVKKSKIISGEQVSDAKLSFDENARPVVDVVLDARGGSKMGAFTRDNIGKNMAVLFVETKRKQRLSTNEAGEQVETFDTVTDKTIISNATVQGLFSSRFQISGLDSQAEAKELALLLRAGALAAPMYFVEERTIGPSLGAENINRGVHATLWGFVAIAAFMIVYYQVFGVISVIALAFNLVFLTALLGALNAALTLPGIAAIALALGMAIDANVLINERIREELRNGASPKSAIMMGYERAFATIVDSNVTTFIVGLMLLLFGSGPVRGFAVVHCLGILTSVFSSVVLSRALVDVIYGRRARLTSLAIGQVWKPKSVATPGK